jgi:hypothetical protein
MIGFIVIGFVKSLMVVTGLELGQWFKESEKRRRAQSDQTGD